MDREADRRPRPVARGGSAHVSHQRCCGFVAHPARPRLTIAGATCGERTRRSAGAGALRPTDARAVRSSSSAVVAIAKLRLVSLRSVPPWPHRAGALRNLRRDARADSACGDSTGGRVVPPTQPRVLWGLRVRRPVHRRRRHTGEGTGRLPLPRAHEEQTLSGVARARAPAELSAKGSPTLRSEHRIIRAKDVRVRSARAHYGTLTRGHRWARTALAELSGLGCGGVSPGDPAEEFPALPLSLGCVHGEVRALEQRRRRLSILWIPGAPRQRRASRYPEGRRGATKSAIVKPTPAPAPAEQRAGD